jgi:superfamily II DNA or RNA helicase
MDEIITKINYHQKEIYKLEKQLHKMKEELKWKNYDEQQKQVIMDKSNLILVEAFPGSGKTHTILGRVKRLVDEDPLILTKIIMITLIIIKIILFTQLKIIFITKRIITLIIIKIIL